MAFDAVLAKHIGARVLSDKVGIATSLKIINLVDSSKYPELIYPMIDLESSWNPLAISEAGAKGLLQIMDITASEYGVLPEELFDPIINIKLGIAIFEDHMDYFDEDTLWALTSYNRGRAGARRSGPITGYSKTIYKTMLAYGQTQ